MPTAGIRVLVFGQFIKDLPYVVKHVPKPVDVLEHIATFKPDVIVTVGTRSGVLAATTFTLHKRWAHFDHPPKLRALIDLIETIYDHNLFDRHAGDAALPLISVYTPTFNTGSFLRETWEALRTQTYPTFEWVVVDDASTDGTWTELQRIASTDPRVRPYRLGTHDGRIGALKDTATKLAHGEFLVELDHDDMLTENALADILAAFRSDPIVGFVYSDYAAFFEDGTPHRFPADWAFPWNTPDRYREEEYHGRKWLVCNQPNIYDSFGTESFEQQFGWYLTVGPNHVRAFRTETFRRLGGYNPNLPVADDWTVMAKFFIYSRCLHIPKLCYLYRVRDEWGNTTFDRNQSIQDHLALARRRYAGDFERIFNLRTLRPQSTSAPTNSVTNEVADSPTPKMEALAFVIASRDYAAVEKLEAQIAAGDLTARITAEVGEGSIFEAYERGRRKFQECRRIVYLHDDVIIQDVPAFLHAVRNCGPGLYGVIGSAAPEALDSGLPWWKHKPLVGRVLQQFPDGSVGPIVGDAGSDTASVLDGLCLVAVEQSWSWLLPGNPPLWHGYDWLACHRTRAAGGEIRTLPQLDQPLLLHRGYGREETLRDSLHTVAALSRTAAERRDYSNIADHLPTLKAHARGAVLELGSREGASTTALLEGVMENGGEVWSVDIDPTCADAWYGHPRWHFVCGDSTSPETIAMLAEAGLPEKIDTLFVDTDHTYAQVTRELRCWLPRMKPNGVVLVHDTESFPEVMQAIKDVAMSLDLFVEFISGCNGLAVIRVPNRELATAGLDQLQPKGPLGKIGQCCGGPQGVQGPTYTPVWRSIAGYQGTQGAFYTPKLQDISYVVLDATASPNAEQCLASIAKFSPGSEIILVGNGVESTPAARALATHYLQLEGNIGFAAGCNRGAKLATGNTLCFMNDDAQFVDAATPERLLKAMWEHSGIVAPYTNRGKAPQGNWASPDQVPEHTREVEMVTGMCMMLPRYSFGCVDGFDTRFTTWEDDDLCKRIGLPCHVVGGTWVDHKESQTFQAMGLDPQVVIRANGALFARKHAIMNVAFIARNEAAALDGFIDQFPGRVICMIDTGSDDDTVEKAKQRKVVVSRIPNLVQDQGFAAARNTALGFAHTCDWLLMLDPDERLDPQTLRYLPELLFNAKHDIYLAPLIAVYPDGSRREFVAKPFLFRNKPEISWTFKVHEKVIGSHKQALIANGRIEHIRALHDDPRRQAAEGLYAQLAAQEPYFTDPTYRAKMREEWPILDYDRMDDPRIDKIHVGPLVSVVIPTYKRPELLAKAVTSAQTQTWANLEIIVVGDCDPTLALASSPPGLRVINLPRNYGAGGAIPRNIGIQAAQSEYIAYLDDDNEWTPEHVASIMNKILAEKATWGFSSMSVEGTDLGFVGPPAQGGIDTSCVIHHRSLFDKHGPWKNRTEANYWHDWELFSRWVAANEPWVATTLPTLKYGLEVCGQAEYLRTRARRKK